MQEVMDEAVAAQRINLLTAEEAAAVLRISPKTLEGMRLAGTGPRYFKVGPGRRSRVVYRRSDMANWLDKFGHASTGEYTA